MNEIELKLLVDHNQERLLRRGAAVRRVASGPPKTRNLHSTYYDTADHALSRAGIALRLRRDGRRWVQTVKKSAGAIAQGLSIPQEDECELPGAALDLGRIADDDLREEVIGLARPGLDPSVETAFRRTTRHLTGPAGGTVELAIDVGEVRANGASEAFTEAELELKEGAEGDLFALARDLFTQGPIRFSNRSKAARAARLRDGGRAVDPPAPLKARPVKLQPDQTVEDAAVAILNEIQDQIAANVVATVAADDIEGPHQLRIGLRRLRSALGVLRPAIGCDELDRLRDRAREIGALVGRLRDLDVFAEEVLAPAAERAPDEPGFASLAEAVASRRRQVGSEVREALAGGNVVAFVLDLAGTVATRGWRRGDGADADAGRTVERQARKALDRRWKALRKRAAGVETLTLPERHEMRKEIKKLRYTIEIFDGVFIAKEVSRFRTALKRLQDDFGALNDAAMTEALLMAPDAPGGSDPDAQLAAGRVIGKALAEADHLWPQVVQDWRALEKAHRFWR